MEKDELLLNEENYFRMYILMGLDEFKWSESLSASERRQVLTRVFLNLAHEIHVSEEKHPESFENFLTERLAQVKVRKLN